MVAELLLYNLVNSQDVLMSDLAFLAVHKVVFEPLNILVDSIGCCLNISVEVLTSLTFTSTRDLNELIV